MIAAERETVAAMSDDDDVVYVTTSQRRVVAKVRKAPGVRIVRELNDGNGGIWLEAEVPTTAWDPISGIKRTRTMSPEAKRQAAERMRQMRREVA